MGNTFGKIFRLTTFGESHGKAIGGVIDGCPAGLDIDFDYIQSELERRKPGQSKITTKRNESDKVEFLSGIFEGKTLGTPIGFLIQNENHRSSDYSHLKDSFRPSHADFTYERKYGIRDYRGGGRSSARETACRVVAGAIAKKLLAHSDIDIRAYVSQVGKIGLNIPYQDLDLSKIEDNIIRCPDSDCADSMIKYIEDIRREGDTIGGVISTVVLNVPIGLGEPVFDKLNADIAKAILSINAVKGFSYGSNDLSKKGSEVNDIFEDKSGKTRTNNSGGIQGGISNGNDIYFDVQFKAVSTIMKKQESIDNQGNKINLDSKGRHDPCVLARAVPIVEAMTALVFADHLLIMRLNRLDL